MLGCSSGSLRRGEYIHPRGRSRRPVLASTLHNRHGSARLDAQKGYAGTPWRCPVVMVSIPLARRHGKRVSVASSVDRQSKGGVNFRRTRRRCFSVWLSRSGKAWEDRPGRAIRHPLPSSAPHKVRDGRRALCRGSFRPLGGNRQRIFRRLRRRRRIWELVKLGIKRIGKHLIERSGSNVLSSWPGATNGHGRSPLAS